MPRLDRTYTHTDLIRFFTRNLDATEQEAVDRFFAGRAEVPEEAQSIVEQTVGILFQNVPIIAEAFAVANQMVQIFGEHPLSVSNALQWARIQDVLFTVRTDLDQIDF